MANSTSNTILSVCATTSSKLKDLGIKDGQLIFVHDNNQIAFDFDGKRKIYNQITELESEAERQSLLAPITGQYYFVIETTTLWTFNGGWIQLTIRPEKLDAYDEEIKKYIQKTISDAVNDIVLPFDNLFLFPITGSANTIYIDTTSNKTYRWDDVNLKYYVIGSDYNDIKTINGGSAVDN